MTDYDDLFADFEAQMAGMDAEVEGEDLSQLPLPELLRRQEDIDEELGERGELINVRTERGRELHSLRTAVIVTIHTRSRR